jgi:hypothetical protein
VQKADIFKSFYLALIPISCTELFNTRKYFFFLRVHRTPHDDLSLWPHVVCLCARSSCAQSIIVPSLSLSLSVSERDDASLSLLSLCSLSALSLLSLCSLSALSLLSICLLREKELFYFFFTILLVICFAFAYI